MSRSWVALAFLVGCSGSGSDPDGSTGGPHKTLTWDADGAHETGQPEDGASVLQGVLTISGNDLNGHGIAFGVMTTTAGTYDFDTVPGTNFSYTDHAQTWTISTTGGGTGSITITSFTADEVVGTFVANPVPSGSATGMPAITNGVFDFSLAH